MRYCIVKHNKLSASIKLDRKVDVESQALLFQFSTRCLFIDQHTDACLGLVGHFDTGDRNILLANSISLHTAFLHTSQSCLANIDSVVAIEELGNFFHRCVPARC
jgi:hypothetical protein